MDGESSDASTGIRAKLRPILRIGVAALLLGLGVSKFLTYGQSVQFFETLGLPVPAEVTLHTHATISVRKNGETNYRFAHSLATGE